MTDRRVISGSVGVVVQEPNVLMRDRLRTIINDLDNITVLAEVANPNEAIALALKLRPEIMLVNLSGANEMRDQFIKLRERVPGLRLIWLEDLPEYDRVRSTSGLSKGQSRSLNSASPAAARGIAEFANPILVHYADIVGQRQNRDAAIIETLASAIDAKETTAGAHAQRVAEIAAELARNIDPKLGANQPMRYGFVLHDIGKIGIPEGILLKEGALDPEEWATVKTHPILGVELVEPLRLGEETESVIKHHHERWDGHGYPDGLVGEEIPLGARIFSVADTFDAITNDRPYRSALPKSAALAEIRKGAGKEFDPQVVESFFEMTSR